MWVVTTRVVSTKMVFSTNIQQQQRTTSTTKPIPFNKLHTQTHKSNQHPPHHTSSRCTPFSCNWSTDPLPLTITGGNCVCSRCATSIAVLPILNAVDALLFRVETPPVAPVALVIPLVVVLVPPPPPVNSAARVEVGGPNAGAGAPSDVARSCTPPSNTDVLAVGAMVGVGAVGLVMMADARRTLERLLRMTVAVASTVVNCVFVIGCCCCYYYY